MFRVLSRFREIAEMRQGNTHEAVPYHERHYGLVLLGKRQELRRKLADSGTIERYEVYDPEAVEYREK